MTDVSVVSTVYNESQNFDRSPPSILSQSYSDFEWVILDDCSTDGTYEKLSELASNDPRVRVLQTDTRRGRAPCLNQVIKEANGKYIAQQDFDDISFPNRLNVQKSFLDDNPNTGVVGGYFEMVDEIRGEHYLRKVPTDHDDLVRALTKYIPFAHTIVMFRKAAWKDVGGYPHKDDIEDLELWIKMVKNGWKIQNVPISLGKHHIYEESSFHSRFKQSHRQQELARTQKKAVKLLNLPKWMYIYPTGRLIYSHLPNKVKRLVRHTIGQMSEKDM